jgi:Uma2 family endonuclease
MMATVTIRSAREVGEHRRVAFRDIGWTGYASLLRLRGGRSWPRMIDLNGTVWLMSPTCPHERLKTRLGEFVTEILVGLRIRFVPAASTTLRRRAKEAGVEGDQTYYLANEARIRGKDKIDFRTDLPPDPAIKAVYTHAADEAVEVYRRIRVPEVWICDEAEPIILVLQADSRYSPSATSAAFPFSRPPRSTAGSLNRNRPASSIGSWQSADGSGGCSGRGCGDNSRRIPAANLEPRHGSGRQKEERVGRKPQTVG